MSSQSELLDESLALLTALEDSSNEPWWGEHARQELHDQLFRYFVALGGFGTGAYVDNPRSALKVCISGRQTRIPKAPAIARPVQLGLLEFNRRSLRDEVRLAKLKADLSASFGPQIVSSGNQSPRPADQLAKKFLESRNNLRLSGISSYSISKWEKGTTDFTTHNKVVIAVQSVLEACLPFGDSGVLLPQGIKSKFDTIDTVEQWLAGAMDGTPHPSSPDLLAFGLALTATGRAYLADVVCALVSVALPLHRLYEETRLGAKAMLSMSCANEPNQPAVEIKRRYNSYMAVGLVELLTGDPMPHLDSAVGDGYLNQPGALRDFCAWQPLLSFWGRGTHGTIHQQFVDALEGYQSAPVLQVFYDPKTAEDASNYITLENLRQLMKAHAFPALDLPPPRKEASSKEAQPQSQEQKKPDDKAASAAYKTCGHFIAAHETCGHFITHLRLYVAIELSSRLAAALAKRGSPGLSLYGQDYIRIGAGSQRWGGNHLPHAEHRDGFTYDISCPKQYEPWATKPLKELTHISDKGKPQARKSVFAVGVPNEDKGYYPHEDGGYYPLRAAALEDSNKENSILRKAFSNLVKRLMAGEPGDEWDALAGTPILLRESQLDDSGLVANLVGHVALVLAGVVKWVYSSWYEHLFALRATAALLAPGKCPDSLKLPAKTIRPVISGAEFYWKPLDHHDHWHVVFAKSKDPRHSLGPTPYQIDLNDLLDWVMLWDALGVDLISFKKCLERRTIAHQGEFPDAVKERQTILDALSQFQASAKKMSEDAAAEKRKSQDKALDLLAEGIAAATWHDIPSLAGNPRFNDWLTNSSLAHKYKVDRSQSYELGGWQAWPPDTNADPSSLEKLGPPTETDVEVE